MSTLVFQGLQSCLDSQLTEQRALWLKLATPKVPFSELLELGLRPSNLDSNYEETEEKCPDETTPFSSNPTNFSSCLEEPMVSRGNPYTHPQSNRCLSPRSLELCTESLGSETGSDISDEDYVLTRRSPSGGRNYSTLCPPPGPRKQSSIGKQSSGCRNFPPPLTTISGSHSLQIKSHRDGGRVVMEAVVAPARRPYFQAERSNGRLRLSFLKSPFSCEFDEFEEAAAAPDEEGDEEKGEDQRGSFQNEHSFVESEGEKEEDESDACLGEEDVDATSTDFGAQPEMEKFQRPSRCKGGCVRNENLLKWEPFCVATS